MVILRKFEGGFKKNPRICKRCDSASAASSRFPDFDLSDYFTRLQAFQSNKLLDGIKNINNPALPTSQDELANRCTKAFTLRAASPTSHATILRPTSPPTLFTSPELPSLLTPPRSPCLLCTARRQPIIRLPRLLYHPFPPPRPPL